MKVSVITTAYDEEKNITPLHERIKKAMNGIDYEVVAVDDGSTDNTYNELRGIRDRRVKIIRMNEHRGKCFALHMGISKSSGEIIATIDADGQNDPGDIPGMVKELEKGYDCICGWRYHRKDTMVKRISSKMGNFFNNMFMDLNLHDNNCPVKVFKRHCVARIRYFDNFHRFIPILIKIQGFKIREYKVRHYPRIHGVSKYGIRNRIFGNIKTIFIVKLKHKELIKCN
ncbi:MAG: glycosyltransferase family 2 protein [Candidatus Aenigmarchaeota archaeon]|nr:glycosyltransferase family 2 protein [Candidatus Aenigmarchaeota archaeon]